MLIMNNQCNICEWRISLENMNLLYPSSYCGLFRTPTREVSFCSAFKEKPKKVCVMV